MNYRLPDWLVLTCLLAGSIGAQGPCSWAALGGGGPAGGSNPRIDAMIVFDDGSGPDLYVGGGFTMIGGVAASAVARWDGTAWSPVGQGLVGFVQDLEVFDDGTGPALYACGTFSLAGIGANTNVARWNGSTWSTPGLGVGSYVEGLRVFDDGNGAALYVVGSFSTAGGIAANNIARWNGTTWSAVGGWSAVSTFHCLEVFDDGSGPALYAGGSLTLGGIAGSVARWDGTAWSAISVPGLTVRAMAVYDDGGGPALHLGGSGTGPANGMARWDGTGWTPLGAGLGAVSLSFPPFSAPGVASALAVFDDGSGPALYVGGQFPSAGGVPAAGLARWDGSSWSAVGSGTATNALAVHDDGAGIALFAGGFAGSSYGISAGGAARWSCGTTVTLSMSQPSPGAPVFLTNANLVPGGEYYNVFSFDLCPGGPGTGNPGLLGLCANNLAFINSQLMLPLESPPFHFTAPGSTASWGPLFLPPLTVDAVCLRFTNGSLGSVSPVNRILVL